MHTLYTLQPVGQAHIGTTEPPDLKTATLILKRQTDHKTRDTGMSKLNYNSLACICTIQRRCY
jgi:hypothetical protein